MAPQITQANTIKILKAGLTSGRSNTVTQQGFGLTDDIVQALDITNLDELGEWRKGDFKTLLSTLRSQKIPVTVAAFNKLEMASEMIRVLTSCDIPLELSFFSPKRMNVWKRYSDLIEQKKAKSGVEKPSVLPKLDRKVGFVEFIHKFELWTKTNQGLNDCGLHWVIREEAVPIDPANNKPVPTMTTDKCHLEGCTSISDMIMKYWSHDDPLYDEDNGTLLDRLKEALKGSTYIELIAPFDESRNGREAWKQLLTANTDSGAQYEDAQRVLTWLKTHKWKDTGNILLKSHVAQHRRKHQEIATYSKSSSNVAVLKDYEKCFHLFASLVTKEPSFVAQHQALQKAFEQGRQNPNFEVIAAELMRHDPVAKKGVGKDGLKTHFDISSASANEESWELKFYPKEEYNRLKELHGAKFTGTLYEWRKTPEGKKMFNAQMAAHQAKGGKGSQTSKKRKSPYEGMSRSLTKKFKTAKAKAKYYESDEYKRKIYSTFVGSSNETSSSGSSSSANASSTAGPPKSYADFETVLKSIQKDRGDGKQN